MLINSYAKINLYLEVLNKRTDGYHEIETLFSTINLFDSLKFALTKKPRIKILSNIPELASENNLIYKVAVRMMSDFGINKGIEIDVHKRIPVSAGLGGGSSNAAMTILALNKICDLNLEEEKINDYAAEFGSDLNFFLYGGFARGMSRGEKLQLMPDQDEMKLLLVNPGISIRSSEAYDLIDLRAKVNSEKNLWYNRLECGIRIKYPTIDKLIIELKDMGASKAMMSGSGATCIGYFHDNLLQEKAADYFSGKNYWVKTVKTLERSRYKECIQNLSL